jgi:2-keto-4-pentenoate hydratase/2-oxohepta-3-ene-1,7-dioic acid hydratase in catechol pathway
MATLPNRQLEINLVSIDNLKLPAGNFRAYHFESALKEVAIWISTDERRIPLKIEGAGVFGYTLLMKEAIIGE